MANPPRTAAPGEVFREAVYTLGELDARLGLGKAALRKARRQGLVVKRIGRRAYVYGGDLIDWFTRLTA